MSKSATKKPIVENKVDSIERPITVSSKEIISNIKSDLPIYLL
ncbi:MAG: hypothetical protein ACERKZ_08615 [Lachnotalea sp.]